MNVYGSYTCYYFEQITIIPIGKLQLYFQRIGYTIASLRHWGHVTPGWSVNGHATQNVMYILIQNGIPVKLMNIDAIYSPVPISCISFKGNNLINQFTFSLIEQVDCVEKVTIL